MINFILIAVCIIAGMLLRKSAVLPADAHKGINAWLIYIALPAVSFKYLPNIQWSTELLLPAISPILIWLGAFLYIRIYAAANKLHKATEGGLRLTTGLSNTSFIGFPLIMAYYGEKEIAIAIICDQVTFTLLSTAGIIVAIRSAGQHTVSAGLVVRRVLRFPPFLACVAALTIPRFVDIAMINPLFDQLAVTVAPLALFSIGYQLQFSGWRSEGKHITIALLYKLILAPAIVMSVAILLSIKGTIAQISIFEAAMPTFVTAGIVANEYGLNPKLSNLVIGVGIVIAFATTFLWFQLLQFLK